jgi:hypothetical protein
MDIYRWIQLSSIGNKPAPKRPVADDPAKQADLQHVDGADEQQEIDEKAEDEQCGAERPARDNTVAGGGPVIFIMATPGAATGRPAPLGRRPVSVT